jgi:hypothetical protein
MFVHQANQNEHKTGCKMRCSNSAAAEPTLAIVHPFKASSVETLIHTLLLRTGESARAMSVKVLRAGDYGMILISGWMLL